MTAIGRTSQREVVQLPDGRELVLSWSAATDVGLRRQVNEDSYIAQVPVFVVADGMGGHEAGGFASTAVVVRLAEAITGSIITPAEINEALKIATADINRLVGMTARGGGTTVTGAALTMHAGQPRWAVFNIGDSRTYLYDTSLKQVTVDHSLVQEMVEAGMIKPEEAEHHPESNVITRAVGFDASPIPDLWLLPMKEGQRLLMCSDGLTKEVSEADIGAILAANSSPRDAARALVAAALENTGRDNVTAVVVDVITVPPKKKRPAPRTS